MHGIMIKSGLEINEYSVKMLYYEEQLNLPTLNCNCYTQAVDCRVESDSPASFGPLPFINYFTSLQAETLYM